MLTARTTLVEAPLAMAKPQVRDALAQNLSPSILLYGLQHRRSKETVERLCHEIER